MQPKIGVMMLIVNSKRKLLFMKDVEKGSLVVGDLQFGETLEQCCHRVALTLAGITIRVQKMIGLEEIVTEQEHLLYALLSCTWQTGVINATNDMLRWQDVDELKQFAPEAFNAATVKAFSMVGIETAPSVQKGLTPEKKP